MADFAGGKRAAHMIGRTTAQKQISALGWHRPGAWSAVVAWLVVIGLWPGSSLGGISRAVAASDPFRPSAMATPAPSAHSAPASATSVMPATGPGRGRKPAPVRAAGRISGPAEQLSLSFDHAPIGEVFRRLARHLRINLVMTPGVKGTVTLHLHRVPAARVMNLLADIGQLQLQRQKDVLLVRSVAEWQRRQQQEQQRLRQRRAGAPLFNRLVTLQHADASELAKSLQLQHRGLLTDRGSVRLDRRTNSLILRDSAPALDALCDWIAIWDIPLEQVMISAHIVTISRDSLREFGIDWGYGTASPGSAGPLALHLPLSEHYARMGLRLARLAGRLLELELTALEQENRVEILASPRLYTAHQQPASIKQGTEIPYQVAGSGRRATSIQFKEAVLSMEVTPKILRNGKITLDLRLGQNVPGQVTKRGENESIAIDVEEIRTRVTIANGETVVLGGIFQQQKHQSYDKIPLLADLPLVGELFKRQRDHYKQRELVIFITPTRISG